ncbi:MAG: hypothetical protein U0414_21965 [Polyangiaceae bacterium]
MASQPIYEATLPDGREIAVVEWEQRGRVFREVFVLIPAPPQSDPALYKDRGITIGPHRIANVGEIIALLPALGLPAEVASAVASALNAGARASQP